MTAEYVLSPAEVRYLEGVYRSKCRDLAEILELARLLDRVSDRGCDDLSDLRGRVERRSRTLRTEIVALASVTCDTPLSLLVH